MIRLLTYEVALFAVEQVHDTVTGLRGIPDQYSCLQPSSSVRLTDRATCFRRVTGERENSLWQHTDRYAVIFLEGDAVQTNFVLSI